MSLTPDMVFNRIYEISLDSLKNNGIQLLLLDLDNTLTLWKKTVLHDETVAWVQSAKEAGFEMCIVSNSNGHRAGEVAETLGINFVKNAGKPFGNGIKRALQKFHMKPSQVAIIGDQLYTDVMGGKRAGIFTILLRPIDKKELIYTRFIRIFERRMLKKLGIED